MEKEGPAAIRLGCHANFTHDFALDGAAERDFAALPAFTLIAVFCHVLLQLIRLDD